MISLRLSEIAQATQGKIINASAEDILINSVSTDTRSIKRGDLFIALQGESFDAHHFLLQAENAGAALLLVHQQSAATLPSILVEDTRIALGQLAAYVKQKIAGLKCAAITGSNGKTTTKELLSQILRVFSESDNAVLATAGNFNNDIGLPLTLLRLTEQNTFAVVELGANHQGEIAYTASLSKPDVALINNVMPAHLEGFGSIAGVAQAKGEIWQSLAENGTAVVNLDDSFAAQYLQQLNELPFEIEILTFSQSDTSACVFASGIRFDSLGKATFTLNVREQNSLRSTVVSINLAGKHNISNALAASAMACALGCGLDVIQHGLASAAEVSGRVNSSQVNELVTLIDDTYNANSASVKAAVDLLACYAGERLLVLGDMAELGDYCEQEHLSVGKYAAEQGINGLLTVGRFSSRTCSAFQANCTAKAVHFDTKTQLKDYLENEILHKHDKLTVLVKGSRGAKMEEIVTFIKQSLSPKS
ncbi:UDP-N-acetylmuramoyl-tripeptide--D-alanyl-D-alanine ligase [Psychromonas ossibalaenae]|uniref:UDP-N-acetylmuramoyl-tripeptide--D-alanyl-D- alanine ligase n=1 Tax=Psychromonas ossibalaenae TaxID=444922 RepID=UPI00037F5065|nr:UDP-N-acetylmuramoyl-tripeptide--D-alanyl-D-alanine ligase [Psychromonas ossibalaenae]